MAKNDKKIAKIDARIAELESEMALALQKKVQGKAYDVPGTLKKIEDLKRDRKLLT